MGYRTFSREAYGSTKKKIDDADGDTSFAGRQHIRETKKLHPLVDPAGYELIRKSWPRYTGEEGSLVLKQGLPMLVENLFDTTGSMGSNVRLAFDSLPLQYDLLTKGSMAVLGRYDTQIINAIFGDVVDNYILSRTQAEMDEKIAEQLTLMVPEGNGGDEAEDPEYGLFAAAFLTDAFIIRYGLKPYHFMTTDAPSHGRIDKVNLVRVFGETVFDRVRENEHKLEEQQLPTTAEIVTELQKRAHAFAIIVDDQSSAQYWREFYGKKYVVVIDSTEYLPHVEAAVIGLTEGILDLQSLPQYLTDIGCNQSVAREIQRAVAGIPLGAQTLLPNFYEIPKKGSVFAKKHDLWPTEETETDSSEEVVDDDHNEEEENTWL